MHSVISNTTSVSFYGSVFDSPLPDDVFLRAHNRGHFRRDFNGFACFTFLDSSTYLDRRERENARSYYNVLEADVITYCIYRLVESFNVSEDLINQIGVFTPYQTQVGLIHEIFNDIVHENHPRVQLLHNLRVRVSTVDSIQVSEKTTMLFFATRSNNIK